MIALITSTLYPTTIFSSVSASERYDQTVDTIKRLSDFNFTKIILIDNSTVQLNVKKLNEDTTSILEVFQSPQYSFKNKGLNEALLILNNIHNINSSAAIFKISGRYFPTEKFELSQAEKLDKYDFIGMGQISHKRTPAFNTRSYFVKDKIVLEKTMVNVIEEMLAYDRGVQGWASAMKFIESFYKIRIGNDFQLSLEQAFGRVLKERKNFLLVEHMNIRGIVAGYGHHNSIDE